MRSNICHPITGVVGQRLNKISIFGRCDDDKDTMNYYDTKQGPIRSLFSTSFIEGKSVTIKNFGKSVWRFFWIWPRDADICTSYDGHMLRKKKKRFYDEKLCNKTNSIKTSYFFLNHLPMSATPLPSQHTQGVTFGPAHKPKHIERDSRFTTRYKQRYISHVSVLQRIFTHDW